MFTFIEAAPAGTAVIGTGATAVSGTGSDSRDLTAARTGAKIAIGRPSQSAASAGRTRSGAGEETAGVQVTLFAAWPA